jgi:hypothetical protein
MQRGIQKGLLTDLGGEIAGMVAIDGITEAHESAVKRQVRLAARKALSAANIADWSTYLPPDCVQSMVRMGWDVST